MKLLYVSVAALGLAVAGVGIACSSSDDTGTTGTAPKSCADNSLTLAFSPMYSSFDGTHTFQVPVIVDGIAAKSVSWNISDESIATVAKDPGTGGIMLTMLKPGTATVVAAAGSLCGSAQLTVSSGTAEDWEVGNQRYNNGVVLRPPGGPRDGGAGGGAEAGAAMNQASCTNCHGPTANSAFKDVAHTPQQTGGFSDEELQNIFRKGIVPDGGYFDPEIVPYAQWQRFHQWDMTDEQAHGIIVYLRSLTPEPQEGAANFGGRLRDGGRPPPREGGAPPPPADGGP